MKASTLRRWMNLWPPFLFAGIKVVHIAPDFRNVQVVLRHRRLNMNYVGTHFGGSLFSMADPFYVVMLMNILGRGYVVWDKASRIEFLRPGTGTVRADFEITDAMLADIADNTRSDGDRFLPNYTTEIVDEAGDVVARIEKTLYIRRQADKRRRAGEAGRTKAL